MRIATDWNKYNSNPSSLFSRHFFLNFVIRAYADLLKNINFAKPIEVLEFGSGTGYINKWLGQRYKVKKLTLIDANKKMLNIAKKTLVDFPAETEFIEKDFFHFKTNNQYDLVHSQGVIEHFELKLRQILLKKHYDSTKIGGYGIVYSPAPSKPYFFFRKLSEILKVWRFTDEVPLSAKTIIKEMESFGFIPIKTNIFWKYFLTEAGTIFKKK